MNDFRILLAGSRTWPRGVVLPGVLRHAGDAAWLDHDRVVLVHGACEDGADAEAHELWTSWGWPTEPVPAAWPECAPECIALPQPHRKRGRHGWYCPGAGMRRNAVVVDRGADMMLAFVAGSWSPGTQGCIRLAKAAGILVWTYRPDGTMIDPWPKPGLQPDGLW